MIEFLSDSPTVLALTVCGFIISFTLSVGIGANDVANAFGTTYGAKLLNIIQIIVIASIFEVSGALLIGTSVAETIRKGILDDTYLREIYNGSKDCISTSTGESASAVASNDSAVKLYCADLINIIGSVSALTGSSIWMLLANIFSLPVSTTHSIVGSYIGFGLVALRGKGIKWAKLINIVISWFLSPCVSGLITISIWLFIYHYIVKKNDAFQRGLRFMPGFYFITIFIIIFSVVFKGSSILYFDRIPLYGVIILCIPLSIFLSSILFFIQNRKLKTYSTLSTSSIKDTQVLNDEEIDQPNTQIVLQHPLTTVEDDIPAQTDSSENKPPQISQPKYQTEDKKTSFIFKYMQILIACYGSFAHGGNDVSNGVAPLITIWLLVRNGSSQISFENKDIWLLAYGSLGIVIGLAVWGKRVLKTVGNDITTISPTMGYSIELGSVITVVFMTRIGIPVSTTHCKIGSVILLGILKNGRRSINKKLIINILLSWFVTVPISAMISATAFAIIQRIIFKPS